MSDDPVAALRREVALRTDLSGRVTWADPAATRILGVRPGDLLRACAPPDLASRLDELIGDAGRSVVNGREVCVLAESRPVTMAFNGAPVDGGVVLVGTLAPEDFGSALQRVNDAMNEIGILHRRAERQQQDLQRRNDELVRLNRELDDASRATLALHADLEDKVRALAELSATQARLVAGVSHEFRTPLYAIAGLVKLMLDRVDGELTSEQEMQLGLIRDSAAKLAVMVEDMLELARSDAGRNPVRISGFTAGTLFASTRGLFRAVHSNPSVELVFEPENLDLPFETDEGKLSQILRNLIANALKFTERGTVRVTVAPVDADCAAIAVSDTGIGIVEADRAKIFEEFMQVDGPIQRRLRGTGLGLPLSRRLAATLGGTLTVASTPGEGSTFTVTVPRHFKQGHVE